MSSIISAMSSIIWIVVLVFIFSTVKRIKNMQGKTDTKDRTYASVDKLYSSVPSAKRAVKTTSKAVQRTGKVNNGDGIILKDDRNNDWLAMQLREEAKAKVRMSDMFQLKTEHANKCEAEFIKRFHESNCDANDVDSGVKRK